MSIPWSEDEIILACELVMDNDWRDLPSTDHKVVELSDLLIRSPLHPIADRDPKFRNPAGVHRKTVDLMTAHPSYPGKPTKGNRLDRVVIDQFEQRPEEMRQLAREIRKAFASGPSEPLPDLDLEEGAKEGRILQYQHLRRERSPKLRARKLADTKRRGLPIACEVCGFDFETTYGPRGEGYIEVHHVLPLHVSGAVTTRLADLALLCSNCHRMMHRAPWTTPAELGKKIRLNPTHQPRATDSQRT
jgi:5-methylcytosine-specific restriction protein A